MSNYQKVHDRVFLIDTLYLFNGVVASYYIIGEKFAIIDTGYAATYNNVVRAIAEINKGDKKLDYIIPTHIHMDHGGAIGHLAKQFNNAVVYAHERAVKHIINPSKLIQSVKSIFPEDKIKSMGLPIPVREDRVLSVKGEEEILDLGNGVELRFIYTPGHAPHHISLYLTDEKIVFTGDAVAVKYPNFPVYIPTTPAPRFDPDLALKSIKKIKDLEPKKLFVPHFGPIDNVEEYLEKSEEKIREWLEIVKGYVKEDLGLFDIIDKMIEHVALEAGVAKEKVPFNVKGSIYISVFGLLDYYSKMIK